VADAVGAIAPVFRLRSAKAPPPAMLLLLLLAAGDGLAKKRGRKFIIPGEKRCRVQGKTAFPITDLLRMFVADAAAFVRCAVELDAAARSAAMRAIPEAIGTRISIICGMF
jgi:hypothetical protein